MYTRGNKQPKATIHQLPGGMVELRVGYDAQLVAAIKQRIPVRARSWNPDTKCWLVNISYLPALLDLLEGFCIPAVVDDSLRVMVSGISMGMSGKGTGVEHSAHNAAQPQGAAQSPHATQPQAATTTLADRLAAQLLQDADQLAAANYQRFLSSLTEDDQRRLLFTCYLLSTGRINEGMEHNGGLSEEQEGSKW